VVAKARSAAPRAGTGLEIRLLGELVVLRDGRALALPASKKTRALLGYLVATGRAHTRESLCDLFWDGPDDPRAALRWSLAKLRPLVDDGGTLRLVADRERVHFEPQASTVDLTELRALVAPDGLGAVPTEALLAAVGRLRGELLEGLELPDCYRYGEWCRAERESARGVERALRSALVERLEHVPEAALGQARALCAVNPLDEAAHVAVMRLLARLGRHKDALLQYETCRRILAAESGARPSALLEQARSALGTAPAQPVTEPPTAISVEAHAVDDVQDVALEVPLVGRAPECATLADFVRGAPGSEQSLLVLGEPGVGKTRLLLELARSVHAAGGTVLRGRAFEAEMIRPYGAWIDAVRELGEPDPFASGAEDSAHGTADRARLFSAVVARLRSLDASGRPAVVILDDIHWLDEASAALIHFAARALVGTRVRIACGARPGELADNLAARRLVRALTREGMMRQIGLSPLDRADIGALVRPLGDELDAERVFAESGGNPLFALEVARALAAGSAVSGSLEAMLRERLEQLEGAAREVAGWAATFGGVFSTEVLMRVTGLEAATLVRSLEELERRGFIRPAAGVDGALGYDFAHDLMRRAAYHAISEPRRRLMHVAIARVLAVLPEAQNALAGDIAHHAGLGDDAELAARASLWAAERCVRLFANDEANALVERGLRSASRLQGPTKAHLEIGLLRVAIYADGGRRRAPVLEAAMQRALVDAEAMGCAADVARGLMALSYLHFDVGDFAGATADSLRAEAHARTTAPAQALHALAHSAQCLALLERELPRAESMAAEAARLAADLGADVPELWLARALIQYYRGQLEPAIALFVRALALAERMQEHWLEAVCLARLAMSELHAGRPRAALQRCARLREVVARMGESSEGPLGAALEAVARRALGEPDAERALADALAALQALDAQTYLAEALCFAAEGDLRAGAVEAARGRATSALRCAGVGGRSSVVVWAHALLARAALAAGDSAGAGAELERTRPLLEQQPFASSLAHAHVAAAEAELAALAER
jgi:DNA-binding SARP family transcriptional activator/tetratricopeptide (TPR) repeat protein